MRQKTSDLQKLAEEAARAAAREVCRIHLAARGADEPAECPDGCPAAGDCPLGRCRLEVRLRPLPMTRAAGGGP